jgi:hypothetical protein
MHSYIEQKKYIESLQRYERKMTPKEQEFFKMTVKRQKDDEDLDSISFAKLKELYDKYYVNRKKKSLDELFKK